MALTITPGLDFGVDELPTKLLLNRQAESLQINGITADKIEGDIIAIVFGDESGVSGADPPDQGWIWVDQQGHRTLGSPRFDARMWSAHGGWESGRHNVGPFNAGGFIVEGRGMGVAGTEIEERRLDMDLENLYSHVSAHKTDSNVTAARVIFRGGAQMRVDTRATLTMFQNDGPGTRHNTDAQAVWDVVNTPDQSRAAVTSYLYSDSPGTSAESVVGVWAWGWVCGVAQNGGPSALP